MVHILNAEDRGYTIVAVTDEVRWPETKTDRAYVTRTYWAKPRIVRVPGAPGSRRMISYSWRPERTAGL